jgi:hypothetical protein
MEKEFTTVEINVVRLEVDLRTARRVENYRIGDRVKVLVKEYSSYKPTPGVIVAFDMFEKMPTITVAYLDISYSGADIKFAYISGGDTDKEQPEIAPYNDDIKVDKANVIASLDKEIYKKQTEIEDLEAKKNYFEKNFQKYFEDTKQ